MGMLVTLVKALGASNKGNLYNMIYLDDNNENNYTEK